MRKKPFSTYFNQLRNRSLPIKERRMGAIGALRELRFSHDTTLNLSEKLDSLADELDSLLANRNFPADETSLIIYRGDLARAMNDSSEAQGFYRQVTDRDEFTYDSLVAGWRIQQLSFANREPGPVYDSLNALYHHRVYRDLSRFLDQDTDTNQGRMPNQGLVAPNDKRKAITVEAFPNPFSNSIELQIALEKESDQLQLEVLDVLGTRVYYANLGRRTEVMSKYTIESVNWPAGIYYARLITVRGDVQTVKIVKE